MTAPLRRSQRTKTASPKCRNPAASPSPSQSPPKPKPKPTKITKRPKSTTPPTPKRKMSHESLLSPLSTQAIRNDFRAMGVSSDKTESLMAAEEPVVDRLGWPTRSREEKEGFERRGGSPGRRKRVAGGGAGGGPARQGQVCPVAGEKNWVLFNPVLGFPPLFPAPAPDSPFQRFAVYQPGNKKIVLYNLVSGAVRLCGTPEGWVESGVEVEYHERLGVKVVKKGEGKRR